MRPSFLRSYLRDRTVIVEGRLARFLDANPHAMLIVMTDEGQAYTAEWAHLNALTTAGVTKATLKPGDHIVVAGSPTRDRAMRQLSLLTDVRRPSDGRAWKRPERGR